MADRLFVFGGGGAELRGGHLFAKAAIAQYLKESRGFYREVHWLTHVHQQQVPYVSRIEGITFTPCYLGQRGWLCSDAWRALGRVMTQVDGNTIALIWLPHPAFALIASRIRRRSGLFAAYVGNDWIAEAAYRKRSADRGWFAWASARVRAAVEQGMMRRALRIADLVLVRGAHVAEHARKYNDRVVESLPLLAIAPPTQVSPTRAERAESPLRLLYVGKLNQGKGVEMLIEALARTKTAFPFGWTLAIAGSGPARPSIERQIIEADFVDRIRFCGYVDAPEQLSDLYAEADALVVPSVAPEGAPRVIDEALLCGLPVVAAEHVVSPGMLATGAVLSYSPSVENLAGALSLLATDKRVALKVAARAWAALRSQTSAARQHATLFEAALSGR